MAAGTGARQLKEAEVRMELNPALIQFQTDDASLRPESSQFLMNLGQYLELNSQSFGSVEIGGHADQRGTYEYNLKLSGRRAKSVMKALSNGGLSRQKMDARAYSFSRPIDAANTERAWAKNRRVELIFRSVKKPQQFERTLIQFGTGSSKIRPE